jgi:hypothetical protein
LHSSKRTRFGGNPRRQRFVYAAAFFPSLGVGGVESFPQRLGHVCSKTILNRKTRLADPSPVQMRSERADARRVSRAEPRRGNASATARVWGYSPVQDGRSHHVSLEVALMASAVRQLPSSQTIWSCQCDKTTSQFPWGSRKPVNFWSENDHSSASEAELERQKGLESTTGVGGRAHVDVHGLKR